MPDNRCEGATTQDAKMMRSGADWVRTWRWLWAVSAVAQAGHCSRELLDALDHPVRYPDAHIHKIAASGSAATEEKHR